MSSAELNAFDLQAELRKIEDRLEQEGFIVRCPCFRCGQETQANPEDARWATCDGCHDYLGRVARWLDDLADQEREVQRNVELGPRKEVFFVEPGELWLLTPKGRLKLRYFDPSDYTDERIIYKVKTQLTYL